jgi:WD40 repeat protein/serine/threonine protein kinase/tetratricopeptide (TPR) repeat protein
LTLFEAVGGSLLIHEKEDAMPDSSGDRNPVELLAEEFISRKRRGEKPTLSEYTDKYPDLAPEIRDLFPALLMMEDLGDSSIASTDPHSVAPVAIQQLGEFRILREVGRGGMGVVYEAEQESLGRRVALKVLPPHALNDAQQIRRFEREAKAAARLHHTNIVPVFGVGHHEGTHYYVMQFIQGLGLDAVLEELRPLRLANVHKPVEAAVAEAVVSPMKQMARSLVTGSFGWADASSNEHVDKAESTVTDRASDSFPARLPNGSTVSSRSGSDDRYWRSVARIGVQAANALEYAHNQGVLHRDIKPSNLLMDINGTVWVADFGLAKSADAEDLTHTGDIVGTIRYMAPERFQGRSDTRSDVYSLGLTLYELIALDPAFSERDRPKLIQQVLHEEPLPLRKLNRAVPRDLETIVQKATAKEPGQRYARAVDLAEDLQQFLEDRPIRARRAGLSERFWRWCRRNPALAASTSLAAFGLVAITALSVIFGVLQSGARTDLSNAFNSLSNEQDRTKEALRESRRLSAIMAAQQGLSFLAQQDQSRAELWLAQGLVAAPADDENLQRVIRENLNCILPERTRPQVVFPQGPRAGGSAVSPDGTKVLVAHNWNGPYQIFDSFSGKPIGPALHLPSGSLGDVCFSPNSKLLLIGNIVFPNQQRQGESRLWNAESAEPAGPPISHVEPCRAVAFSPDGNTYLIAGDKTARLWDVATNREITTFRIPDSEIKGFVEFIRFSADGQVVLLGDAYRLYLFKTDAGEKPFAGPLKHDSFLRDADFSPNGKLVVTASEDRTVRVWEVATGKPVGHTLSHEYSVVRVKFSPDSDMVATGGGTLRVLGDKPWGLARLWKVTTGEPVGQPMPHQQMVLSLAFSPDGQVLFSGAGGKSYFWDTRTGKPIGQPMDHTFEFDLTTAAHSKRHPLATFTEDGEKLVSSAGVWIVPRRRSSPLILAHQGQVTSVAFSHDGQYVVTGTERPSSAETIGTARIFDAHTGVPRGLPMQQDFKITSIGVSPDGKTIVTGGSRYDGARLWDGSTGKPRGQPLSKGDSISRVAFSPDGKLVAVALLVIRAHPRTVQLFDVESGLPRGQPLIHARPVKSFAFSPNGRLLLTGSEDHTARLWDVATGVPASEPLKHDGPVNAVAFGPDGRTVLTGSDDKTARLWEVSTGKQIGSPLRHEGNVLCVSYRSDGKLALTSSADRTARLWNTNSTDPVGPPLQHQDIVRVAAFSPDGNHIATGSDDHTARIWDAGTGIPIGDALLHDGPITQLAFSADGLAILTAGEDRTARVWEVPTALTGSAAQIALWAEVATGLELDTSGAVRTVDDAALEGRAKRLSEMGGSPDHSPSQLWNGPATHYRAALECLYQKHWFSAKWHLDRLLNVDPRHWAGYTLRGLAEVKLDNLSQAATDYAKAFDCGPSDQVLSTIRMQAEEYAQKELPRGDNSEKELKAKRLERAIWYWDQMIDACPKDWSLHDSRGRLHAEAGDRNKAELDYTQALALNPPPGFFSFWGDYHGRLGDLEKATLDYQEAVRRGAEDLESIALDGELHLARGDRQGFRLACRSAVIRNEARSGIDAYWVLWLCSLGPDAVPETWLLTKQMEELYARSHSVGNAAIIGTAYYRAGKFDRAIALLEKAVTDPDSAKGGITSDHATNWLFLALAHARLGQVEKAANARAKALTWLAKRANRPDPVQGPGAADWNLFLATQLLLDELDHFKERDAQFDAELADAVRIHAKDPESLVERGRFYANRGQWDKAAVDFDNAIALEPKNAHLLVEYSLFSAQKGNWNKSSDDLLKAAEASPESFELRVECSRLQSTVGRWDRAAAELEAAVSLQPDNHALRLDCGHAYARAENWNQAIVKFEEARERQPHDVFPRYFIALSLLASGRLDEHREVCAQMLAQFGETPDFDVAARIMYSCLALPDSVSDAGPLKRLALQVPCSVACDADLQSAFDYRTGEFKKVVQYFPQAFASSEPLRWLFVSMAYYRLDQREKAVEAFEKAERWIDLAEATNQEPSAEPPWIDGQRPTFWAHWRERTMTLLLRKEAEALIKPERK